MRLAALFCAASLIALTPNFMATAGPLEDCRGPDVKAKIRGCTAIIKDEFASPIRRAEAYFRRGLAYGKRGDHDRAISDFTESLNLKPNKAGPHGNRGIAYIHKGQYDLAIRDLDEAIRLKPFVADGYLHRGRAYLEEGDLRQAIEDLDRAIEIQPRSSRAHFERARAFGKKGDHDKAIADASKAIQYKPDEAGPYAIRGIAYAQKGDFKAAIRNLDKAIRLKPDVAAAYLHRGKAYRRLKLYDDAIRDMTRALQIEPNNGSALYERGAAYDATGKRELAIADIEKALQIAPSAPWSDSARSLLGRLKVKRVIETENEAKSERVALVIGNARYEHAPRLNNPQRDASAVADAFRRIGFAKVVERHDLDGEELREELKRFGDLALGADWAVIYFAGHGLQVDGRSYLIPTDAKLRRAAHVEDEAIEVMRMVRKVRDASKLRMVILDACRENPFVARMKQRGRVTRSINRGLGRVDPAGGVMIAYAAREGQLAADGDGRHSPFTAALLRHLETPGLEISLLFRKVRDDVLKATDGAQEPFVDSSLPGESFYFNMAAAPAE